jgi:hypothetical protein
MAHIPSFIPTLKKFGLDPTAFAAFLESSQGFVAGGAPSAAFFAKHLGINQDLDIWIPIPVKQGSGSSYKTTTRWDTAKYCTLIRNAVSNFFTRNQDAPSSRHLLSMSLEQIAKKYNGVYNRILTEDVAEYTKSDLAPFIQSIDTFENPWTSRRIQVIFTYDVTRDEIMENFDFDVCQFYTDGSDRWIVKPYNLDAKTLSNIRSGNARILFPEEHYVTDYQYERLQSRVAKYEERGYTFTWASTGCAWDNTGIPDAPTESFWQDIIVTTKEVQDLSNQEMRDLFFNLLNDTGCHFKGSDTEWTIQFLLTYFKKAIIQDKESGDNWKYTWRFTWDADKKEENIYLRKTILLNLY